MARKTFLKTIFKAASLFVCLMLDLSGGAGAQGEESDIISEQASISDKPGFYLRLQGGFLSAKIENAPVGEVLMAIARQKCFKHLRIYDDAALSNKISVQFQNLTIDEGVQRILRGKNYSLIYTQSDLGREKDISARLEEVVIFGKGGVKQAFEFDLSEGKKTLPPKIPKRLIRQALNGEDAMIRAKAVVALGESGDRAAIEPLSAALQDDQSYVREHAVEALGKIGGMQTIAPLERALLEDEEEDVREGALEALVRLGRDHAIKPLGRALENEESEEMREELIEALGELGDQRAMETLATVLQTEKDWELRAKTLEALAQIRGDGVIDPMVNALQDEDSDVREQALISLAKVGSPQAAEALQLATEHEDREVREKASKLLGKLQRKDEM